MDYCHPVPNEGYGLNWQGAGSRGQGAGSRGRGAGSRYNQEMQVTG